MGISVARHLKRRQGTTVRIANTLYNRYNKVLEIATYVFISDELYSMFIKTVNSLTYVAPCHIDLFHFLRILSMLHLAVVIL